MPSGAEYPKGKLSRLTHFGETKAANPNPASFSGALARAKPGALPLNASGNSIEAKQGKQPVASDGFKCHDVPF